MCFNCGQNNCNGCYNPNPTYTQNWFSTGNLPCDECSPIVVCQRKQPSQCVVYNGPTLVNLNVTMGVDTLNDILLKLDSIKALQDTKNINILAALNDINTRLNTLEGGTHVPYTLL